MEQVHKCLTYHPKSDKSRSLWTPSQKNSARLSHLAGSMPTTMKPINDQLTFASAWASRTEGASLRLPPAPQGSRPRPTAADAPSGRHKPGGACPRRPQRPSERAAQLARERLDQRKGEKVELRLIDFNHVNRSLRNKPRASYSAANCRSTPPPDEAWRQLGLSLLGAEVDGFYWTDSAPDIVNSGREEQGLVSV
jgi:hypothetical protein